MNRLFLTFDQRRQLFKNLKKKTSLSWEEIATEIEVSSRTLRDWRNGKYSLPSGKIRKLEKKFEVAIPRGVIKRPQYWYVRKAGRLGAIARNKKYGNPGTREGRIKGGRNSILTHKMLNTAFRQRNVISYPRKSAALAEFVGIMLGDGGLSNYQASITLNRNEDAEYSLYAANLINRLFNIKASIYERPNNSTVTIVVSSVNLVEFLIKLGLMIGNKVKQSIDMPTWISEKKNWQTAFLRGIFDTDGSVYLDKHKIKGKIYKNLGMVFSAHSQPLLASIKFILNTLEFLPTDSHRNMIQMRRENEIKRYFQEVGTNNLKHSLRFKKFLMERYRSGHNGAASKAVRG